MYEYKATVVRIIDADTVQVEISLGFDVTIKQRVRINGIDAPERHTEPGKIASIFLRTLLPPGSQVVLRTYKEKSIEKYGRFLADILLPATNLNIADQMLSAGHATPYSGGARL